MKTDINFEKLPLWQGVKKYPEAGDNLPFSLGWDNRGFIIQTTSAEIKNKIVQAYAAQDYSYGTKPPGFSKWSDRLGDVKYDFVKQAYGSLDGINVVEIGAGSLSIAQRLTEQYKINKYWIFDPAINVSSVKENIYVSRDYFQKQELCNDHVDLVLGFSVLEHILDPVALLTDLRDILIPSRGKAIFSFPDIARQFKNGDLNSLLHEHFNYFTMSTAEALFNRCGFDVLECESENDVLWYYLEVKDGDLGLDILPMDDFFYGAAVNFQRNIESVSYSLNKLQSQGKIVALHGACNGLNNILFLSGIKDDGKLLIFDSDETKAGAYLSACSVPIRFSQDTIYETADKVFISALSYYPEIKQFIIAKHGINPSQIQPIYPDAVELEA